MQRKVLVMLFANLGALFIYEFLYGAVFYASDYNLGGDLPGLFLVPLIISLAVNSWLLRAAKHNRLLVAIISMLFAIVAVFMSLAVQALLTFPARG